MKSIMSAALALVAFASVTQAQTYNITEATTPVVYYSGALQLSEITVASDGATKTYDIPATLSSNGSFSSEGQKVYFGPKTKCAPIGKTVTDLKIPVSGMTAYRIESSSRDEKEINVAVPKAGTLTVPAGTFVVGNCAGESKTLNALGFDAASGKSFSLQAD